MREQTNANDVISDDLGKRSKQLTNVFKLKHQFTHLTWDIEYTMLQHLLIYRNDLPQQQMTWFNLDDRDVYISRTNG